MSSRQVEMHAQLGLDCHVVDFGIAMLGGMTAGVHLASFAHAVMNEEVSGSSRITTSGAHMCATVV